jgi:hypothetical protein
VTTPGIDHDADAAALGEIEAEVASLLGIDRTNLTPLDRLKLHQGVALQVELARYDLAQRSGQSIDAVQRGKTAEALLALAKPQAESGPAWRLEMLSDAELMQFEMLTLKAMGRPISEALDPPAGTPAAQMWAAHQDRMRALAGPSLSELEAHRLETAKLRSENVRLSDEARALRAERDKQAADIVGFKRLVEVFLQLSEAKGTPLPQDLPPNVIPLKPPPGAA